MNLYERLSTRVPVTVDDLCEGFAALGVRPGAVVEVHAAVGSLGWVVGGAGAIVHALLRHLGPGGTLLSVTGWDGTTFHLEDWPEHAQAVALASMPPFDRATSAAEPAMGVLAERIRTWPGAVRSAHPEASMTALGARAPWLAGEAAAGGPGHPDDDAFGAGSPLGRLVEADGQVLLLGAPLSTVTLVHHAEATAPPPPAGKRRVTYRLHVRDERTGVASWRSFTDIDTTRGAFPYEDVLGPDDDYVEVIATAALRAGTGRSAFIGESSCHCFEARTFLEFAVAWLADRFG